MGSSYDCSLLETKPSSLETESVYISDLNIVQASEKENKHSKRDKQFTFCYCFLLN